MARTIADDARVMISPYLQEVDTRPVASLPSLVGGLSPHEAERLSALHCSRELKMVYDYLAMSFVVMEERDLAFLVAKSGPPRALAAVSAEERATLLRLAAVGLVMTEAEVETGYRYDRASIEINTHCNYRCVFCPVATAPLPKRVMEPALYELVLRRVADERIPIVVLNHYGEPSLDPHLVDRVRVARDYGLTVDLYTNASKLDADKLRQLAAIGNFSSFVVNLPSLDPDEFQRATRWKQLDVVVANVRAAADLGLPVRVSLNLPATLSPPERRAARDEVKRRIGIRTSVAQVHSRAGNLENAEYARSVHHQGRLGGCYHEACVLCVNVEGQTFLCCQDYHQEHVVGDLRTQSIRELAVSAPAVRLRRFIFGLDDAPDDFMCRKCEKTCSQSSRPLPLSVGTMKMWDWPETAQDRLPMLAELEKLPVRATFRANAKGAA